MDISTVVELGYNIEEFNQFWKFIFERQRIWHKRVRLGEERPWTTNRVLQEERFTNIYRELDPGTTHLIDNVLEADADVATRLFTTIVYRMIGSREDVQAYFGLLDPRTFEADEWAEKMRALNRTQPVFGSAYQMHAGTAYGEADSIGNISKMLEDIAYNTPRLLRKFEAAPDPANFFKNLTLMYGIGRFLANQVIYDISYPLHAHGGKPLVPIKTIKYSHELFSVPGIGAKAGIKRLTDKPVSDAMKFLRDSQHEMWSYFDLNFYAYAPTYEELYPHLSKTEFEVFVRADPKEIAPITLTNIEGCLCEYYKFAGITEGSVRGKRKFFALPPQLAVAIKSCMFCKRMATVAFSIIFPDQKGTVFVCGDCAQTQLIASVVKNVEE